MEALIPKNYVQQGRDARRTHEKQIQILLQQVDLPVFILTVSSSMKIVHTIRKSYQMKAGVTSESNF